MKNNIFLYFILIFITTIFAANECEYLNKKQCNRNSNCEWIDDECSYYEDEDDEFEFEDDDFDLDDFEGLDDFEFDEDDFDELLEEFEIEEEEGYYESPRNSSIGFTFGNTSPFGRNLISRFNSGLNFSMDITTPLGFYIGPLEILFGGEFSYSNMGAIETQYNPDEIGYTLFNILVTAKTKILFLNITSGYGFSITSGPSVLPEGTHGDLIYETLPTLMLEISCRLLKIGPVSTNLKFKAQETFGVPGVELGTSDLIGFGLGINIDLQNN